MPRSTKAEFTDFEASVEQCKAHVFSDLQRLEGGQILLYYAQSWFL